MTSIGSPQVDAITSRPRMGLGSLFLMSAWFGLIAGFLELTLFLCKCNLFDTRNYNVSRQFRWMYPIAGLVVVAIPGTLIALATIIRRQSLPSAMIVGILAYVASLGVFFQSPLSTTACLALAGGVAVQSSRFFGSRARKFEIVVRRTLPIAGILLVAMLVISLGPGFSDRIAGTRRAAVTPNVILIVLDTVRAQSLSLYGYPEATSPNLARIAERGVRFDRAFSTAPWTAPSHASMFTGHWAGDLSIGWNRPLETKIPTLAEVLSQNGYDTVGFVANTTYCSYETGLDRGFRHYEDYDVSLRAVLLCSGLVQRVLNFIHKHPNVSRWIEGDHPTAHLRKSASRISDDFLKWESSRASQGRPFFAFLNYYDAHHPYLTPGNWEGGPVGRKPRTPEDFSLLRSWWGLDKKKLDKNQIELVRDSYEHCIAYLDHQIGQFIDELDRRGVLKDTLVIITADHGEHLGEHGLYGHGISLYLPEIHVPLLIFGPEGTVPSGRIIQTPVSLRDLAETVLDRLGIASERVSLPGRSLAKLWSASPDDDFEREPPRSDLKSPPEDDPNRGESPIVHGPMTSLIARGRHYIRNGDGREELFDLDSDPGEAHDLASLPKYEGELRWFRQKLERLTLGSHTRNTNPKRKRGGD